MTRQFATDSPFKTIVCCTDFSENADFAFDFAVDAASRRPGCVLYLLHVVPEPDAQFWKTYIYEVDDVDQKAKHDIDERVDTVYRPRVPSGVDFRVEYRIGKESEQILTFAKERQVDLIVMGRHGHSSLGKMLFGQVTEKITRKADCAVLVIPLSFERRLESPPEQ